jgi:hypothetical protein
VLQSLDSGFDAHASPRMMVGGQTLGASQFAIKSPAVDETAVTTTPHDMSTAATVQLHCLSIASDVNSKVA